MLNFPLIGVLILFVPLAALATSIGIGGGAFFVPVLLFVGFDFFQATSMSLVMITTASLSASYVFLRSGLIDPLLLLLIGPVAALASLGAGYGSSVFPEHGLQLAFVVLLLLVSWRMARSGRSARSKDGGLAPRPGPMRFTRERAGEHYEVSVPLALVAAAAAGTASGLFGIGGGLVLVPVMTLAFGLPIRVAVANSSLLVGITACFGATGHALSGHLPVLPALLASSAVVIGGQIGARITIGTRPEVLRRLFAALAFVFAITLAYESF